MHGQIAIHAADRLQVRFERRRIERPADVRREQGTDSPFVRSVAPATTSDAGTGSEVRRLALRAARYRCHSASSTASFSSGSRSASAAS